MSQFAIARFNQQIEPFRILLSKASRSASPGEVFYRSGGRNVVFRLEALCRMYRKLSDKNFFEPWYREFKNLEDWLGSLDHNEAMVNEFSKKRELKKAANAVFGSRYKEEIVVLSAKLKEGGWLNGERIKVFTEGLKQVSWHDDADDREDYVLFMIEELEKVFEKYDDGELDPFRLEEGVHEIRRRLRWVSIYAAASNGLIQLRNLPALSPHLQEYCTDNIVQSPYNKMPSIVKGLEPVMIQSQNFYALSWMIQYLGDLKDIGLRYESLKLLIKQSGIKGTAMLTQFKKSLPLDPADIGALAEIGLEDFFYRDRIVDRITRDILRSFN